MFAEPLYLVALFLNSQQVLLALGIVSLIIAGYIFYKRSSYKADETRLLQKTSLNKSIGIMSALAFVLIIMSWTSKSRDFDFFSGNLEEDSFTTIDVPLTTQEVKLPPQEKIDPPKLETADFNINDEKPEPTTDPEKEKSPDGTIDGTGKADVGPKGPVMLTRPTVSPPKKRKEPIEIGTRYTEFAEHMPRFADNKCEELKASGEKVWELKKACADRALSSYLAKTVNYPTMAREAGFEGVVYVRFIVDLDGSINNIEVVKDNTPGGGLKQAAVRAVEKMAKKKEWIAGEQGGEQVRVRMVIPIKFQLSKGR